MRGSLNTCRHHLACTIFNNTPYFAAHLIPYTIRRIMKDLGFTEDDAQALVGSFSGGWKMRIGLAKILATDP
ncbi:hypothetical protein EON63_21980 [archaeon]|nr:MAG: hypothetical protein EON63_21980 [archaeon]